MPEDTLLDKGESIARRRDLESCDWRGDVDVVALDGEAYASLIAELHPQAIDTHNAN